MKCILCTAASKRLFKDRTGTYYDCPVCRGVFLSPDNHPTPEAERARYLEHNNDIHDPRYQAFVEPIVNAVTESFTPKHKGLDYGCGTGPVISHLLTQKGFSLDRYDPFFNADSKVFGRQYDFIVACEVIEHFHDPRGEFARLRNMLNRGGKLLAMTEPLMPSTDFADWYYKNDQTHVFFYRPETFEYIRDRFHFDRCAINGRLIELS
jgi:hypothetical protein